MRQVNICSAGECGGECYRCRLRASIRENNVYASTLKYLLDLSNATGRFGPWADDWSDSWQWLQEQVETADPLTAWANKQFAPEESKLKREQDEYDLRQKQTR